MNGRIPNFGSDAVDAQTVPKRNLKIPIFPIAGTPDTTRNSVINRTKATDSIPQMKKIRLIAFSAGFLAFFTFMGRRIPPGFSAITDEFPKSAFSGCLTGYYHSFFILYLAAAFSRRADLFLTIDYFATGTAPAFLISSSASLLCIKSKKACACGLSSAPSLVITLKLR